MYHSLNRAATLNIGDTSQGMSSALLDRAFSLAQQGLSLNNSGRFAEADHVLLAAILAFEAYLQQSSTELSENSKTLIKNEVAELKVRVTYTTCEQDTGCLSCTINLFSITH